MNQKPQAEARADGGQIEPSTALRIELNNIEESAARFLQLAGHVGAVHGTPTKQVSDFQASATATAMQRNRENLMHAPDPAAPAPILEMESNELLESVARLHRVAEQMEEIMARLDGAPTADRCDDPRPTAPGLAGRFADTNTLLRAGVVRVTDLRDRLERLA